MILILLAASERVSWGQKAVRLFLAAALILPMLLMLQPAPSSSNVQPALLSLAHEKPNETVRLIVQSAGPNAEVSRLVENLGGTVVRDLRIINALAVEMSAAMAARLADNPAVRWVGLDGPIVKPSSAGAGTVRDEFNSTSYSNNDGTVNWASNWMEEGESNGPDEGDLRIKSDRLRIKDDDRAISRQANLDGALSATLSFDYRRINMDGSSDYVALEISADGGTSWTELDRFMGPGSDADMEPASYDIAAYASASTTIRFATSSSLGNEDYFYVDDLQIEFDAESGSGSGEGGSGSPSPLPGGTYLDAFDSRVYDGSHGTSDWSGSSWIEIDEPNGPGPDDGPVQVSPNTTYCLSPNCLRVGGTKPNNPDPGFGVMRQVDLSGASTATLSFSYRRGTFDDPEPTAGTLTLDMSADGGATWTTLHTYSYDGLDVLQTYQVFDVSAFASADTRIRFLTHGPVDDIVFFIDNIQIDYAAAPPCIGCIPNTYLETLNVLPVWDMGYQGQGITVAVIDSGIAPDADFSTIVESRAFGSSAGDDPSGHGTHVAGIIAGNGTDSGGFYRGIAPQVDLISLAISDETGMAYESDAVAALQWVYDNKDAYNIRVVNMSLNSTTEQSYHSSPMDAAAEILWFNGVVVVASVGNNGAANGPNTANAAPANDPFIITVGAADEHGTPTRIDDAIGSFSAQGITTDGFVKPDIISPGKSIYSVLSESSTWSVLYPERCVDDCDYFRLSGTSMAAPMVSGAVALLLQAEPNLTPDQVKYRLLNTGTVIEDGDGYAYMDVYDLLTTSTTESANTGIEASQLLWTGDDPITWDSVSWNSVSWNSVSWNSVSWNSVSWNSVSWNSVSWND